MKAQRTFNDSIMWDDLAEWIIANGGTIHSSLEVGVCSHAGQRGVFCRKAKIAKGEVLIELPHELALGGENVPGSYHPTTVSSDGNSKLADNNGRRHVSTWLRCVAALYQATTTDNKGEEPCRKKNTTSFHPYLASLPSSYDTLWQWTTDEVKSYLSGTTSPAGASVGWNASDDSILERYRILVRPFLEHCNILTSDEGSPGSEYNRFKWVCQTLSTRAFHFNAETQQATFTDDESKETYDGPFLLPAIDMLNHSGCLADICTTLQRTSSGFTMVAEKDIDIGAEILHSYDKNLTASQFLHTFGFVPMDKIEFMLQSPSAILNASEDRTLTPALLSKQEILDACYQVIESDQPEKLAQSMEEAEMEDETWSVTADRSRNTSSLPHDILVSTTGEIISHELITLVCLPFLPKCAAGELNDTLLDESILDDYFLGKLVCSTILRLISQKLQSYHAIDYEGSSNMEDADILRRALKSEIPPSWHLCYGITVRLEEKASINALRREVIRILARLDGEEGDDPFPNSFDSERSKRQRILE